MTPEQRQRIVETLQKGQDLDADWAKVLFPPDRREYELVYQGKERKEEILSETMAVPLQPVRSFGKNGAGWHNKLIFGDNLQVMKTLLEMKERGELKNANGTDGVKFAYIDPPFAAKREFRGSQEQKAYQDKMVGVEFLEFLRRRLVLLSQLLADDGVLFVHTDWKKGPYVRVLLDEILGESRFRNEVIWWYYNKMQGNVNRFPSNHENIFFYSNGSTFTFNAVFEERAQGMQKLLKRKWDSKTQRLVNARDDNGELMYIETDQRRIDDVLRLSMLQPADKTENLGFPTQKPETLLAILIEAASNAGDIVMDCFAGSGTTLAVAEKLGRRWIGVDCGKFAIYTVQKRMLNLRQAIGNDGPKHSTKPFTLYNAGLYDFSRLRELPWEDWRFFALQLFQCKDDPHEIGGIKLDGYLKSGSVLVFNHFDDPDAKITYDTIDDIHEAIGKKIGRRFFIIAPAMTFSFHEDYVDRGDTRYYPLRIPYSIIHELHRRDFTAIRQPMDEKEINDTVESVGFDFIRTPDAKINYQVVQPKGQLFEIVKLRVTTFKSEVVSRNHQPLDNLQSLSMILVDLDYDGEMFDLDISVFADQLQKTGYGVDIRADAIGDRMMVALLDIYGNEFREVRTAEELKITRKAPAAKSVPRSEKKKPAPPLKKGAKKVKKRASR